MIQRFDSTGRDVTDMPGLWDNSDNRRWTGEYPREAGWYWFRGEANCCWSVVEVYQEDNWWMYARNRNLVDDGIHCEAIEKDTVYQGPLTPPNL